MDDIIKEYIRTNLSLIISNVNDYGTEGIKIELLLEDEVIDSDWFNFPSQEYYDVNS